MPQDAPRLPDHLPGVAEMEAMSRPIPDMTANVNALVDQVRAVLDGYQAAGEVLVVVDVLQWKSLLTLHVPFPKG